MPPQTDSETPINNAAEEQTTPEENPQLSTEEPSVVDTTESSATVESTPSTPEVTAADTPIETSAPEVVPSSPDASAEEQATE